MWLADDQEYLWIAKEAYQADLPAGWEIYFDEEGKHFYYNTANNTSTYEHPSIDFYRKLFNDFKLKDVEFRRRQEERDAVLHQNLDVRSLPSPLPTPFDAPLMAALSYTHSVIGKRRALCRVPACDCCE